MAPVPPWKRELTLEDLPEFDRRRFDLLEQAIGSERPIVPDTPLPQGNYELAVARTRKEVEEAFFATLNYGPNATVARDELATGPVRPDMVPLRTAMIIGQRILNAWVHVRAQFARTLDRVAELERDLDPEGGPSLFREVLERIREHYFFEEEWHYTICALFVMQSWVARAGALPAVFYLYFGGAMSSGKSNVLQLVGALTDGLVVENVSPSALARVIGGSRTILLDEFDVTRGEELDDIMAALLRSGYRRNGPPYMRWNAKDKCAEELHIFGPKCGAFRSALDPALQSRGFVIPTAKPTGEQHYSLVLANLWPRTSDLVARLKVWGQQAARGWPASRLEELARSAEFQGDLRRVVRTIGANRESELLTIALLVAAMVPVDAAASLSSARELREVEVSEEQAEAIEELRAAALAVLEKTAAFDNDGHEVYRVSQRGVRDALNFKRRERQERPISTSRLSLLRREFGVKDEWLRNYHGSLYWNLPSAFVESGVKTPPSGTPPPPNNPTSTPQPHLNPTSNPTSPSSDSPDRHDPPSMWGGGVDSRAGRESGARRTSGAETTAGAGRTSDGPNDPEDLFPSGVTRADRVRSGLPPDGPDKVVHPGCSYCVKSLFHVCGSCPRCVVETP